MDLLFDWFGLVCFPNKNKNCQLSHSWFQTSQTGCQRYSDTSPLVFPGWAIYLVCMQTHKCQICKVIFKYYYFSRLASLKKCINCWLLGFYLDQPIYMWNKNQVKERSSEGGNKTFAKNKKNRTLKIVYCFNVSALFTKIHFVH
jgi:hypothetical protein